MARVLYVDDDDALRDVVRTWLERSGHVVHTAESVAVAKQCLAAHEFDGASSTSGSGMARASSCTAGSSRTAPRSPAASSS
jgi:DNA-binding NtrC family response regulator